jgi:hypothetical protein
MNNSLKAALLSGLGFPGLGQIFLKLYKRAAVIIVGTMAGLAIIIMEAVQIGLAIMENIESSGAAITIGTIWDAARQAAASFLMMNLGVFLIILFWIIGTYDAYKMGKKKDIS